MKKVMMFLTACSFLGLNALNASSDNTIPGAYTQQNNANQVMSVGKTQMQIGATDRAHANYINARSGAGRSHSNTGNGGGSDFQWVHRRLKMSGKHGERLKMPVMLLAWL